MWFVESWEFDVPALICIFGEKVKPTYVLNDPQNCASSFGVPFVSPAPPLPRSARASYHTTARFPVVWSRAIFGKNWLSTPLSSFTRTPALQVVPLSSE